MSLLNYLNHQKTAYFMGLGGPNMSNQKSSLQKLDMVGGEMVSVERAAVAFEAFALVHQMVR
jgi:hypothetical protein